MLDFYILAIFERIILALNNSWSFLKLYGNVKTVYNSQLSNNMIDINSPYASKKLSILCYVGSSNRNFRILTVDNGYICQISCHLFSLFCQINMNDIGNDSNS